MGVPTPPGLHAAQTWYRSSNTMPPCPNTQRGTARTHSRWLATLCRGKLGSVATDMTNATARAVHHAAEHSGSFMSEMSYLHRMPLSSTVALTDPEAPLKMPVPPTMAMGKLAS